MGWCVAEVTTKADFELYKKEAEKWVDFFQLRSWYITYDHCKPHEDLDSYRKELSGDIPLEIMREHNLK